MKPVKAVEEKPEKAKTSPSKGKEGKKVVAKKPAKSVKKATSVRKKVSKPAKKSVEKAKKKKR